MLTRVEVLVPRGWLGKKEKSPVPKRFLLRLCRVGFLQELRAGLDPGPLLKLRRTFQQEGWETFCPSQTAGPPPKPQMRSAVVGRQAVLIQALGFRFCRAGSWAPVSCWSLPPGPPNGAAVRGEPEVGIEVGTKPGPCEIGLEAKRPGLPLSSERKIGETAGGRRTRSSWYAGAPTRVLLRGFQSVYQVNLPLELA